MPNRDFRVERLTSYAEQDAADLGVLRNALSSDRPSTPLVPDRIDSIVGHDDRLFVVARNEDSERIVGCETIVTIPLPESEEEEPDGIAWLGFVSTHPEHRGKGIAKNIAIEGLSWCVEQGLADMRFTSNSHNPERDNARDFYLKYGAVIIASGVGPKDTDLFNWKVDVGLDRLIAGLHEG